MSPKRFDTDRRSVSDTVAFVLMFSIIIMSVAAVSTTGVNQLTDIRDEERVNSAERGMVATAAIFDSIHRQNDPFRTITVPLNTGHLWINETNITVNVSGTATSAGFESNVSQKYRVNSLEHRFDRNPYDVTLAYESGGAFRTTENSEGIVPRYTPSWRCDGETAIVSLVTLNDSSGINVAGGYNDDIRIGPNTDIPGETPLSDFTQGVQLAAELNETASFSEAEQFGSDSATVTVDVSESGQPEEWSRYLSTAPGWTENTTTSTPYDYDCSVDNSITVTQTTIDISA